MTTDRGRCALTARRISALVAAVAFLLLALPVSALTISSVNIEGVTRARLENVQAWLELNRFPPERPLSEAMLAYQLRDVTRQVEAALEPFGYYRPKVEVKTDRVGDAVSVEIIIDTGRAVRVLESSVRLEGEGGADDGLSPLVIGFKPKPGRIFEHQRYEASKANLQRGLLARGYFRSRIESAKVEVKPESLQANIDIEFRTGRRFHFGETVFEGSQLREGLLDPLVPYSSGQPYDQAELLELQRKLVELDYFGLIDIQPEPPGGRERLGPRIVEVDAEGVEGERAKVLATVEEGDEFADDGADEGAIDGPAPEVPIRVDLTPAKRSVYSGGVSFGTDNGAAIRVGHERRWVNLLGHKLDSNLELGQRRSQALIRYRIPEFEWLPGWWNVGLGLRDEEIGGSRSKIAGLIVGRSGRWRGNQVGADFNVQKERFRRLQDGEQVDIETLLVFPSLTFGRVDADDTLYPTRGYSVSAMVRAGSTAIGSDVDFAQLSVSARWIRSFGENYRLLVRGEVASTWVDDFNRLPPSLRFYAGGDRSVRGYGYQELGPEDAAGDPVGGKHLAAASIELERRVAESWAVATFVDAGNAFTDGTFEPSVGVGFGVRWRSPVGPVRLDIGRGLDNPDRSIRLHIGIGPEL